MSLRCWAICALHSAMCRSAWTKCSRSRSVIACPIQAPSLGCRLRLGRRYSSRSPVARTRFKVLIYLKCFGAGACGVRTSPYRSGRSPDWLKMKNVDAPAVKREAEEDCDWGVSPKNIPVPQSCTEPTIISVVAIIFVAIVSPAITLRRSALPSEGGNINFSAADLALQLGNGDAVFSTFTSRCTEQAQRRRRKLVV
jgi:hypothetical protein